MENLREERMMFPSYNITIFSLVHSFSSWSIVFIDQNEVFMHQRSKYFTSKHYLGDGGALDSGLVSPLAEGLGGRSPGGSRTTAEGGELVVISGSLVVKFFDIIIYAGCVNIMSEGLQ